MLRASNDEERTGAYEIRQTRPNISPIRQRFWPLTAHRRGQRAAQRERGCFFGLDLGGKRFTLFALKDQPHTLQFRGESFNVTNSVRFDPYTANVNILSPARFGQYTATLTRPRVFQFSLRYEF